MPRLIWKAPIRYASPGDEAAFFGWLQSIPGVVRVEGQGRELFIYLRSNRLSAVSLREFIALYKRYKGNMPELARFENASNSSWFKVRSALWYKAIFGARK